MTNTIKNIGGLSVSIIELVLCLDRILLPHIKKHWGNTEKGLEYEVKEKKSIRGQINLIRWQVEIRKKMWPKDSKISITFIKYAIGEELGGHVWIPEDGDISFPQIPDFDHFRFRTLKNEIIPDDERSYNYLYFPRGNKK